MRLRPIFGLTFFAASLFAQPATQSLQVTDVRFFSLDGVTRVAIETSGEFAYRSDRIPNPDRLFFDIKGAKPKTAGKKITVIPVGDKQLKRIRLAENVPGVTRIVLDLEPSVEFTASQLGNPDRLIVELRQAGVPVPPVLISAPEPTPALVAEPVAPVVAAMKPPPPLPPVKDPNATIAAAAVSAALPKGARSLTRALGLKINRIVIDPGHGGHDQGTSGNKGLLEKDLVLDVSLRLGKLIEQRLGSEVVFTRSDDTFIPLRDRTELANARKADLFLSIHANSSPVARVTGIETYYLNFTSSAESLEVAARENASAQNAISDLSGIVQSIAKHDKIEESREFATNVQAALQSFEVRNEPGSKDRGIRKAPFVVLIGAQMPSILAEIGFLSNGHEESLLNRQEHRQKLAEALYKGVAKYMQTLSHFEVSKTEKGQTESLPH